MDMQPAVEAAPQPGAEQTQNEICLFTAIELRIKTNLTAARKVGDEEARAKCSPEYVQRADVADVLNPAITARYAGIVKRTYRENSIFAIAAEPRIHPVQQVGRIPAIVVRKSDDLTGTGREAGVPSRWEFFSFSLR